MTLGPADRADAIFGGVDGLTSCLGVLVGAVLTHARLSVLEATTIGLAVAAAVSMAGGDYLANSNRHRASVMGVATLLGSVAPALPFIVLPRRAAMFACVLIALGLGVIVAEIRCRAQRRLHAYAVTFGILTAATVASVLVSVAFGVA